MRSPSILLVVGLTALAGQTVAHCTTGGLTCGWNDAAEAALEAARAARPESVLVLVKDLAFHPKVVHIPNGGEVTFVYADVDHDRPHDPASSGGCVESTVDPSSDPEACTPADPRRCFDYIADQLDLQDHVGETYTLRFHHDASTGALKRETLKAIVQAEPALGIRSSAICPDGSATMSGERLVLPYNCPLHGSGERGQMRGAIVIDL